MVDELRTEYQNGNILVSQTEEKIEQVIKERATRHIRNIPLEDSNGYIWVNHILNFEGGDNYARRIVHPNLPSTEGMLLSTNTTDIKGNRPYEIELNGIKENGELFFDYYFKKMNSNKVAHKLTYAKLYKPYNWVIATGIYLDDIDEFIQREHQQLKNIHNKQLQFSIASLIFILVVVIGIIVYFENHIRDIMLSYENQINIYTDRLEKLSVTDPLTGLFNRVQLDNVFQYEIRQAKRYNKTFSIILLDLDKFKTINDSYGHQLGDKTLQTIANALKENIRSVDTVGRWGGEEFLIICPESGLEDTRQVAEKIRRTIEDQTIETVGHVTASLGVGSYINGESKETLFERADQALYRAKKNGRNRVACERPAQEVSSPHQY